MTLLYTADVTDYVTIRHKILEYLLFISILKLMMQLG